MINIYSLCAIYCLKINYFRVDLLIAFFILRVLLPQRSHYPSSQMLITKQKITSWTKKGTWGKGKQFPLYSSEKGALQGTILYYRKKSPNPLLSIRVNRKDVFTIFFNKVLWILILHSEITDSSRDLPGNRNKWNSLRVWVVQEWWELQGNRMHFPASPASFKHMGMWAESC